MLAFRDDLIMKKGRAKCNAFWTSAHSANHILLQASSAEHLCFLQNGVLKDELHSFIF